MKNLYDKLAAYSESDFYGFHMPGHKRNGALTGAALPYEIDITEIDGFDDLHHAGGILKEAQERAARLYQADETCFLINGSTAGILSGIMGCTKKGDKILLARNCHKSAYHAVFLNELRPVYLYPEFSDEFDLNGPVRVQDVEHALEAEPDIRAIMITSPTYDGVVSDVEKIAKAAHRKGITLIVDEAHGAHFGFHPYFPENANTLGADVVIHSLHKTLPALTQAALLHMNGELADREGIRQYLHIFQTSSPSYVLLSSIDVCMELLEMKGRELFDQYAQRLEEMRNQLGELENLRIAGAKDGRFYDRSKIVISVKHTDWGSRRLYEALLREYHLQMEMVAGSYVLAMTSVGDTEDGLARLVKALQEIDRRVNIAEKKGEQADFSLPKLKQAYTSAQIGDLVRGSKDNCVKSFLLKEDTCVGYISTEYAYIYPPGIPIIVPGEEISYEVLAQIRKYEDMGFSIEGLNVDKRIEVLING